MSSEIGTCLKEEFIMASKKIEMYSEKKYELEEIKDRIKAEYNIHVYRCRLQR